MHTKLKAWSSFSQQRSPIGEGSWSSSSSGSKAIFKLFGLMSQASSSKQPNANGHIPLQLAFACFCHKLIVQTPASIVQLDNDKMPVPASTS
jgi:hypothetical protein